MEKKFLSGAWTNDGPCGPGKWGLLVAEHRRAGAYEPGGSIKTGIQPVRAAGIPHCQGLKVRYDPRVLLRIKDSSPQRELSKEMREKNLMNAFVINKSERVKGKNILLVDDVYTTGST